MNRKMFSLVTSFVILSSSFCPTWAAGKNFTYNNLEKSLAISAEAKEVKSSEVKEELPLVTETMPDASVKDMYARIIFVPETSVVKGVQNYGKLLDKEEKEVPLSEISYDGKVIKGKEYYVLKDAEWESILYFKKNNKQVLYVRKADNNESNPEKKTEHTFSGWTLDNILKKPFYTDFNPRLKEKSIDKPLIFRSAFQNTPCFYDNSMYPVWDPDGYKIYDLSKNYHRIRFVVDANITDWAGLLSLKGTQKKFSRQEIKNSKNIYFFRSIKSGDYKFGDFKPDPINSEGKSFWYWTFGDDWTKTTKDDYEISLNVYTFHALFIGEYLRIYDGFDLDANPTPKGCYKVVFKPEEGYKFNNNIKFKKFAVRSGVKLERIKELEDIFDTRELKDQNNNVYEGKAAWYDGYKKIDDLKSQVINSDKVFTLRRVKDFEAEEFNPVVKEVEVNLNEDVSTEKLKDGITNLPKNVEVEIETKADTSQVGQSKAVLKLIFSDSSSKEVEVPVKVVDKISGKIITPIPTIKAEDIIKEEVLYKGKVDLSDNIKNLPDGAKVEDISGPINTKIPGKYIGKVKVTFKDGSSRIVEIPVEVLAPLSDSYNPSTKEIEVNLNEDVSPKKLKDGITNLPENVEVEIKTKADTSKAGKTKAVLKLIFSDTSSKDVEIPVEVLTPLAEKFKVQMPEKTKVEKLDSLSTSEKSEIIEKVKKANPQASSVEVSDKGEVTLVYTDGSKNIISPEDTIVIKEKESDKKDPEDKPGKEEDNKDPEEKPGKEEENKPDKEEGNKKPEENNEEARDKKENKLDPWNQFPRYYVRDHRTPTYKVDVKINSQVSHTKTQVNPKKFVIDIKSGTYTLTENGKTLEKSMDVKPIIENNRTMLPLRALAEILGAKVIWNDATRTASFTRDGLTALIQIDGNKIVLSNGKTIDLEAKPLNVNGRIYLPLVYVGQVFGLTSGNADDDKENDIEWKEESKTVTINIK